MHKSLSLSKINKLITQNYRIYGKKLSYKISKISQSTNINDSINNPSFNSSNNTRLENIFHKIYEEFDFSKINIENKKEKLQKNLILNKNFIYGESNFQAMLDILKFIEIKENNFFYDKNKIFLDLGSGIGKAVIAMSLFDKFKKCIGVEIMENLYFKSEIVKEKLDIEYLFKNNLKISEIDFLFDDILNLDFSNYDVIFANSTCWTKEFINSLFPKICQLKKGAYFINTDQVFYPNLSNEIWEKKEKFKTQMSWGDSFIYAIRKK